MQIKYFILCFFCLSASLFAQEKFTISGYVQDAENGENLIGANVFDSRTLAGTTTNEYGFFSLTLPADSVFLRVSFIGYQVQNEAFLLSSDVQKTVKLGNDLVLDVFEVNAQEVGEAIQERSQMSTVSIPVAQIKSLPTFLGEVDIIKALQLMPGIQSGSEGSSGLYVRGGGPDQNLILLDGVPVYNASHLFGFFSVFNADAINNVTLTKGGFPARYGGRLSSVLDIRMKEGNTERFGGSLSVGLISSKFTFEGPIKKGKTSFIISGRRTYIDLLARPFIKAAADGEGFGGYYFYDLNGKINHKFSDKDRLYLSAYAGEDKFYFRETESGDGNYENFKGNLGWGNITAMARWNHVWSPKLFSNLTLTYSRYQLDTKVESETKEDDYEESFLLRYFSGISDWGLKYDYDFVPNPSHYIKFGVQGTHHKFKPGAQQFKFTDNEDPDSNLDSLLNNNFVSAVEMAAYVEDDIKISDRLKTNIGLHANGFAVEKEFYMSLQPRISTRFLLNERVSLKASYAMMNQYIHLLSSSSALNLPTDLWVPSTKTVKPQRSHQWALGYAQTLNKKYEISVEGYYKTMDNLIEYLDGSSYLDASQEWENKVASGKGEAYGLEFLFQKKTGKTTGWVGYTLAWSNRTFDDRVNNGETFAYKYDRRHDIALAAIHKFSDRVEISGSWVFGTGNAVTLPIARYPQANLPPQDAASDPYFVNQVFGYSDIKYQESKNGFRMNNYHRMDIGVNFTKQKKRGERRWSIGLFNAYNRKNPFFMYEDTKYTYDANGNSTSEKVYKQVSIFPVLPSLSYKRTW